MTHQKDDSLILSMAGKIHAPIANRNTAKLANAVKDARTILEQVELEIAKPTYQDHASRLTKMRDTIAEIAATICAEQLLISGSATVSSDPNNIPNAAEAAVKLAVEVYATK